MRKGDEDWVKKCMEVSVEGRRPVGRPRTWLECRSGLCIILHEKSNSLLGCGTTY